MALRQQLLSCAGALALGLATGAVGSAQTTPPASAPTSAAPATTTPPDPERVVARVNGQPITEGDIAVAAEDPALALPGTDPAQKRDVLIGYAIDLKLGATAAAAAKLDDTPAFRRRLEYLRQKLLVDEYLDAKSKDSVTPEAARKLYDETVKDMKPDEEVRARHILVADEAAAKAVAARLQKGEVFAKVAADVSTDPGSKAEGGELGFFTRDGMVKPFADAAFALKVGEVSAPVQSQFGWHIIQAEEKRTKAAPAFDEMKEQIDQYLARKAQQDTVLGLRKAATIERVDQPVTAAPK